MKYNLSMPFEKGKSGNIRGKPKGAINKTTIEKKDRADRILKLIESKYLKTDIAKLTPSQRMTLYADMMEYKLPKLQRTTSAGVEEGPVTITINGRGDEF